MRQCTECEATLRPGQTACPKCGTRLSGTIRPTQYSGVKPAIQDAMYGCCEWVADGRCHYAGVFGHGNVHYCRHHEGCTDPAHGAQIVAQSHADIPRPDYSYNARCNASIDAVRREMEAWHTRLETK